MLNDVYGSCDCLQLCNAKPEGALLSVVVIAEHVGYDGSQSIVAIEKHACCLFTFNGPGNRINEVRDL